MGRGIKMAEFMDRGNDAAVVDDKALGDLAVQAHPTWDHFLPLIYTLAQRDNADHLYSFNAGFDLAPISMRSVILIPGIVNCSEKFSRRQFR